MKYTDVLAKGFTTRLVLRVLALFAVFSALSGIFIYFRTYRQLDTNYGAVIAIIADIRESLLTETLWITLAFYLFILIGVLLLGIMYTHRISGPLMQIRRYARSIAEGDLRAIIRFRRHDAIHSFGDTLNSLGESYRGRVSRLKSDVNTLRETVSELKSRSGDEGLEKGLQKVLDCDERINREIDQILL